MVVPDATLKLVPVLGYPFVPDLYTSQPGKCSSVMSGCSRLPSSSGGCAQHECPLFGHSDSFWIQFSPVPEMNPVLNPATLFNVEG